MKEVCSLIERIKIATGALPHQADIGISDQTLSFLKQESLFQLCSSILKRTSHEEIGQKIQEIAHVSSSLASLLTVHSMALRSIEKWGSEAQKNRWLNQLHKGEMIAAFALSEPSTGSNINDIAAKAVESQEMLIVNGTKQWITAATIANILITFVKINNQPTCLLIETDRQGVVIEPTAGMLGFSTANMGTVHLSNVNIPKENILGTIGTGISHVCNYALDLGRFLVANIAVGLAKRCLSLSLSHVQQRKAGDTFLIEQPLIQRKITQMVTQIKAAEALCAKSALSRNAGSPDSLIDTNIAKYFSAQAADKVANIAVHLHGAQGLTSELPLHQLLIDAKVLNLIEGSTEIQEMLLAQFASQALTA